MPVLSETSPRFCPLGSQVVLEIGAFRGIIMAKIKLTKTVVEATQPQATAIELPTGRRVFMLQYRTNAGERRKPALGQFGELTVEQARILAQGWLAEVRQGGDPGSAKAEARKAQTMEALCAKFMKDYSRQRNKPSTQEGYQSVINHNIIPLLGRKKVHDVKRPDISGLMEKLSSTPAAANSTFSVLRKMFNMAEVWGYRPDGSNPCRHIPMFPEGKATRLINDEEMVRIFRHLEELETNRVEYYAIPLAIRLQFEFAARRSEICMLEWDWIDLEHRRVVWPDSKTGGISKPISEEAYRLLSTAPRWEGCPYVLPSVNDPSKHLNYAHYYAGWKRVLKAAGVPIKVGMALTAHKTVTMFMRYVHTEDNPVREAAELVANRRLTITGKPRSMETTA